MKRLALLSFGSIFLIGVFYLLTAKYSINEIDADNHTQLLPFGSKSNTSILSGSNIDYYIPDKIPISGGFDFMSSNNFNGNRLDIKNEATGNDNIVSIRSWATGLGYTLKYSEKVLTSAWIHKYALMDDNYPNTMHIKNMVKDLVLNEGFILKKTKHINGHDIIIKETEKAFIIGRLDLKMDYEMNPPQSIFFESFEKYKFLNKLGFN